MSTQNRIPKVARGRDFILLYTSIQTDRTVRGLSDAAFRAFITGLAEAGVTRTQGVIPAATRAVADMAALEGGSAAAEAAIEELLDAGLLAKVDVHSMVFPTWSRFQPALKDEKARSADAQASANARWHRQGNHPHLDVPNCQLCEGGFPSGGDPAVSAEPPGALEEPPAWVDDTHGEVLVAAPDSLATRPAETATTVRTRLRDAADEHYPALIAQGASPLEAYCEILDLARRSCSEYEAVEGLTLEALEGDVVAHAVRTLWHVDGGDLSHGDRNAVLGFLRDYGAEATLTAVAAALVADRPLNYTHAILTGNKRQEVAA